MTATITSNIASLVDQLGEIKARIAALVEQETALKAALIDAGAGAYDGDLFRATVSVSERETLDMAAVREKLTPQFIRAHTRVTPVTAIRVVARIAKAA